MQHGCKDKFGKRRIEMYICRVIGTKPDDTNKMNTKDNTQLAAAIEAQKLPKTPSKKSECQVQVINHKDIRDNELLYLVIERRGGKVVINIGERTFNDVKQLCDNAQNNLDNK